MMLSGRRGVADEPRLGPNRTLDWTSGSCRAELRVIGDEATTRVEYGDLVRAFQDGLRPRCAGDGAWGEAVRWSGPPSVDRNVS